MRTERIKKKWINNMKKTQVVEEGYEADIQSLRETLKKVPNRKTPSHDGVHGFWF